MSGKIVIERPSAGWLHIDVSSEAADKARVFTLEQRLEFVRKLADTVTLDVWRVVHVSLKRGIANRGFVASLVTDGDEDAHKAVAPGVDAYYASEQDHDIYRDHGGSE